MVATTQLERYGLTVHDLGLADYQAVWQHQLLCVAQRHRKAISDTLLLAEHPPVFTVGRAFQPAHLLTDVPVVAVERGGDITYHGPGQLVAYPIVHLKQRGLQVGDFLRQLEQVVIHTLAVFGLEGTTYPGKTGVWIGEKKVASIGIAVRHWVTFHGVALNVSTDLKGFAPIRPCGFEAQVMTSMQAYSGHPIQMTQVKTVLLATFERLYTLNAT